MTDGFIGTEAAAAPDLMDWVIGVRGFNRRGHELASPYQGSTWERPEQKAICRPDKHAARAPLVALGQKPSAAAAAAGKTVAYQQHLRAHDAPIAECCCGIYGYHSYDEQLRTWPITAVVRARGRLIVHARGFRAERAEVVALAFDPELGHGIEAQRIREVTRRACAWWRIPLLGREQLLASLPEFGSPVPMNLRPSEGDKEAS
jgi:hypothetical protein